MNKQYNEEFYNDGIEWLAEKLAQDIVKSLPKYKRRLKPVELRKERNTKYHYIKEEVN
jgi:hypothetical protein